jgi:hypothetical protein
MLASILSNLKKFREQIYNLIRFRADACMDLLDALCSNLTADSVVKLSLNSHHRRTYNSITDVLTHFHEGGEAQETQLQELLVEQAVQANGDRDHFLFVTDCTSAPRVHSPTLEDRSIVYSPNPAPGNAPITIGHKYSITGFLPPKKTNDPPWVLPLSTQRVPSFKDETLLGAEQLQRILNKVKKHSPNKLCVHVADSGYCKPQYLHALHSPQAGNKNLVTIVRARSDRVFYRKSIRERSIYSGKRGHKLWYGDKFDFKEESTWGTPDTYVEKSVKTRKGKPCLLRIQVWHNIVMRQKKGIPMNEYPFSVCRAVLVDAAGNSIFHKPLWSLVFGERRHETYAEQVYQDYLQRYDIEHFLKFGKKRLLMDKCQSSETQHEENWWSICSLAQAILFVAREAAQKLPYHWEKHLPEIKAYDRLPSSGQVQRSFEQLTRLIKTPALPPKPRGNPLGRRLGEKQSKRKRYSVVKKAKKPTLADTG